jgi:hypothetical protein
MIFASGERELRGGVLSLLETHIVMSSLIFHLVLTLIFYLTFTLGLHLALLHVLFLSSLIDLTITHIVLVHERTALSIDTLVTTHILVVAPKIFNAEVENQHNIKIKVVRSDRGEKYYGRHVVHVQVHVPFARFLQENGIIAQYSMSGDPRLNRVAERRNRTLMDMVRSMLSYFMLLISFYMKGLKIVVHILNRVSSKSVPKTP